MDVQLGPIRESEAGYCSDGLWFGLVMIGNMGELLYKKLLKYVGGSGRADTDQSILKSQRHPAAVVRRVVKI